MCFVSAKLLACFNNEEKKIDISLTVRMKKKKFRLSVILQKYKILPESLISACSYRKQSKCFVSHGAFFFLSFSFFRLQTGLHKTRDSTKPGVDVKDAAGDSRRRCSRSRSVQLPVHFYSTCSFYFIPIVHFMMAYCCSEMFMCMIIDLLKYLTFSSFVKMPKFFVSIIN